MSKLPLWSLRLLVGCGLAIGQSCQSPAVKQGSSAHETPLLHSARHYAQEKVPGIYLEDQGFNHQVVLTFDDGPNAYTPQVLDLLKPHQLQAVFFIVGSKLLKSDSQSDGQLDPERVAILRRMVNDGHVLGNHSFNHPNLSALNYLNQPAQIGLEFERTQKIVNQALGYDYPLYYIRPPFGQRGVRHVHSSADGSLRPGLVDQWLKQQQKYLILWNASSGDWHHQQPLWQMEKSVMDSLRSHQGGVILMHDIQPRTPQLLQNLLLRLKKEPQFKLTNLESLLKQKYQIKALDAP